MEMYPKRKCLFCWWSSPDLLVAWTVMLLTGLSQFIRADDVRMAQLNREKWCEYIALMKSKLMYTKLWFKFVKEERATGRLRRYNTKIDSWRVVDFLIHSFIFLLLPLEHTASVKRFGSLQFLNFYIVGRTPWTGDQPVARPLPAQGNTNAGRQTSMPRVRFEPTTLVLKQAKTVHALDRATTVIGVDFLNC
jgi:hypothetical protein